MLDIDKLSANPHARVFVNFNEGGTVTAFVTEDQAFNFGNNFDAPFESLGQGLSDIASKFTTGAGALADMTPGKVSSALSQYGIKSVLQTVNAYTGSERFSFTLRLVFVAIRRNDNVREKIVPFLKATNPTYQGFLVKAPLGYNANGMTAHGTAAIEIGQWFSTPPFFVVKSFQPTFSRAVTHAGHPLYCVANVTFESYRMLSVDEVMQFFSPTTPAVMNSEPVLPPATR